MPTLLAIFAHPDDESFGPGGTLARYAAEGARVHYLCATRGEAGTVDTLHLNGYRDVGELRTAELMCAAQVLGLADVQFLGFRDSGIRGDAPDCLARTPVEVVAARIAAHLEHVRPDVVITHDPFGGYGHPDHIAVHKAVLHAFTQIYGVRWRSLPGGHVVAQETVSHAPTLFFFVIPKQWMKLGIWLLRLTGQDPRRFGRNRDIDLVQIASWEVPVNARVDVRRYLSVKQRASACHASQLPLGRQSWVSQLLFRRGNGAEHFSRAHPAPHPNERLATTLLHA